LFPLTRALQLRAKHPYAHKIDVSSDYADKIFRGNKFAERQLVPALIQLYVDVEMTGRHAQFYEKFFIRRQIALILKYLRDIPGLWEGEGEGRGEGRDKDREGGE
jgi:hypothetical protein